MAVPLPIACRGPGGASVAHGSRVEVHLYDARAGTLLALANASNPEWTDVYSQPRSNAALKLAPDDAVAALLGELEGAGFSRLATSGPPGDPGALRGYLLVRIDGDERTVSVPDAGAGHDLLVAFAEMKRTMDRYYQSVAGLQLIENDRGHRYFEAGR